jgi:hypothetical protein
MHRPDPLNKPDAPLYSLVRLSATGTNREWYETNLPESTTLPQWAEEIGQQTTQLLPRVKAMAGAYSDSESDSDLDEDEKMVDLGSMSHVHPYRYRIWGMVSSPGDGCTAVLASKYNTQHQERAGAVRLMFGWPVLEEGAERRAIPGLTTEGRLWEWLYGQGTDIPGLARRADGLHSQLSPPCVLFKDIIPTQRCELCHAGLRIAGTEACCENGHSFGTQSLRSAEYAVLFADYCSYVCDDGARDHEAEHLAYLRRVRAAMSERVGAGEDSEASPGRGGSDGDLGGGVRTVRRQVCGMMIGRTGWNTRAGNISRLESREMC